MHYVGVAEGWDVELKQTLDERRHRRHIIKSLITSTQSSKIPLLMLSLPLYVNAGLVWKVRVLFLFPWLLVLSLVLISKRFPKRWRQRGLKEWIGARNVLSESQLRMTVGPVTIVPVSGTHFINYWELFHLLQFPSHCGKRKAPTCLIASHLQTKVDSLQSVIVKGEYTGFCHFEGGSP